ncbi:MAG TPA: EF-P lysine aminoacylase EpmA [Marinagarivorans sp.]
MTFQSNTPIETLVFRQNMLRNIRDYFYRENVIEVDVPTLSPYSVTDVHLNAMTVDVEKNQYFLQTSPEYYMKRLLASGSGSIYSVVKAYRADESGRRHQPEFTMLEWYRLSYNDTRLMTDVESLLRNLGVTETVQRIAYCDVFKRYTGINPHLAGKDELAEYAKRKLNISWHDDSLGVWLDVIFSTCVEPNLKSPTLVYDFPQVQCALAKITQDSKGQPVAKRFELYWKGVELANGYWELTSAAEQRQRFESDNAVRTKRGLPKVTIDPQFIAALDAGLPECAGVALGVDRLLMCLLDKADIRDVLTFPL